MTDTPETDAAIQRIDTSSSSASEYRWRCIVDAKVAQKLERERDAALHKLSEVAKQLNQISHYADGDCPCCGEFHVCKPDCPIEAAKAIVHSIEP